MEANTLFVGGITKDSTVDGPGLRHVLFLAGCSWEPKCEMCQNMHMWEKENGVETSFDVLFVELGDYLDGDVGLTISGGEPLDQAEALYQFLVMTKHQRYFCNRFNLETPSSDVVLYTRYLLHEIRINYPKILEVCDIIIDGPYINHLPISKWRGSNNQKVWTKMRDGQNWLLTN